MTLTLTVEKIESKYVWRTASTPKRWEAKINGRMVAYTFTRKDAKRAGEWQLQWLKSHPESAKQMGFCQ